MAAKAKILLVEDDQSLARVVKDYLTLADFEVTVCEDGMLAFEVFRSRPFDICIVDVMLPKLDGFSLVEKIRAGNYQTPILFLTSKSSKEDRLKGFMKGGDDYITKPFDIEELVLRINVFLKRSGSQQASKVYEFGECKFDAENYELTVKKKITRLTEKEAKILAVLCSCSPQLVARETVLKSVWGKDDYFLGRSMDVYISKLRKYLSPDKSVEIENRHGVGFRLHEI